MQMQALDTAVGVVNRVLSSVAKETRPAISSSELPTGLPDDGTAPFTSDVAQNGDIVNTKPTYIKLQADTSFCIEIKVCQRQSMC